MAFTLYSLMQAAMLCVNTTSVLHEECFRWGTDQGIGGFGEEPGIKSQLLNLIRSVRTVKRVPSITVNSVTVALLLLFGRTSLRNQRLRIRKAPEVTISVATGILEYSCSCRFILQLTKKSKTDNKTRVSI